MLSPDGERYSKKGITPSLLLIPFVWMADGLPWVSLRAVAMLFNPLVTVATALLLYRFVQQIDGSRYVGVCTALIFGVGTMTIIYVKTLFGEPLAGLLLLLGLYGAFQFRQANLWYWLLLAGFALALALGVNLSYGLMIPIVGLYALWGRIRLHDTVLYLLPTLLMGILLGGLNWVRFGNPLETGYYLNSVEGFSTPVLHGITGNWISFYKGVFWFNPVLLLALPGWWLLRKRDAGLAWTSLALIVVQSGVYGAWWAWDGAWSWGPRFLLPVVPILLLFLVPILQRATSQRGLAYSVAGLTLLSVTLQIPGVLFDYVYFYEQHFDGALFNPQNNIILSTLAYWSENSTPDIALLQAGFDGLHLLTVLIFVVVALWTVLHLRGR